ncbi:DUF3696 domain-containing protein [Mucilaginibacter sp. OK283]|uniref:DUF3696 domain-containing protein n=1 Tax=Mucilaginibacter sp. OK283 TaxID=1881049 RepID=UPI0008C3B6A9|nr:DUF3696 domain-containing protein [Mucilaginibacter sp. OK283]SEO14903.1 Protein of unknown function [Mucilaginibacter sp. OK283]
MPNLEGLGLQNFRTFTKKENLEFAPITLITGTNNAGKSSVFKAIHFLVHNLKEGIVSESLDFKAMRHELGSLERIVNRVSMTAFKNSQTQKSQSMYALLSDFDKRNASHLSELPVFEEDEDLIFVFPIKFGGSREISANLEIRYGLRRFKRRTVDGEQVIVSHDIKSISIIKDGEHLHWTNITAYHENPEDGPEWDMRTSLNLKKILRLILDTPFLEKETGLDPNKKTEEYFTLDLFSRIKNFKGVGFDLPFFNKKKDGYEGFTEKLTEGKSLFSDYSALSEDEKVKILAIDRMVTTELLRGKSNNHQKILECFKHSFSNILDGVERDIVTTELKNEKPDEIQETGEEKNLREIFKSSMLQTTPNSQLFASLLGAIEKDFSDIVQKKIDSLNKVYFLPTTRGRNREWFIDEQNGEEIQIVSDFSSINLDSHRQIQNFVNFWIGKGEIDELDENQNKKEKGFKIGKELSVFRDETIGLTKIFLVNFDGTKTPLIDMGYGISQLLPIIMKIAIIAQKHQISHGYNFNHEDGYYENETVFFNPSTLLIEEPEANLHPSLQSKMAELFIDAASRFNIQFLLETHSEYLIYKFQEYIGQKIVSPDDVKMYYFNDPNNVREGLKEKYVNQVAIGKDGSIDYNKYFGEGFFDEQANLKLSLLNIQRDRFVEDYETIKEEAKKYSETLKDYDAKIEQLNQELSNTTSGKNELEEKLSAIKQEKEEKELELQTLITEQEQIIDEYTAKTDYSNYLTEIELIIDKNKIDNAKTLQYLSTGKYLLNNLADHADFAPVIIQYGRAVEFEMIKWVNDFKSINGTPNINLWCNDVNYKDKIRQVFTDLGLSLDSTNSIYELDIDKKVNIFNLKNYISSASNSYVFGGLTQIFELFHYISPTINSTYNYNSVPLMIEFSNYLKSVWSNYNTAEGLFDTCRNILDLRNCAGHTYSSSICTNSIIDKSTAQNYVNQVEAIFRCL